MSSESKTEVNENESEEEEEKQPTKLEELQEETEEIIAVISDLKNKIKKTKTKNENTNELDLRLKIARLKLEMNGYQIEYEIATPERKVTLEQLILATEGSFNRLPQLQQLQHADLSQPGVVYSATFKYGNNKTNLYRFSTYNDMLMFLHESFPPLKHKHLLVVKHKDFTNEVVDDASLASLFVDLRRNENVDLCVDTKCLRFSEYGTKAALVTELLDCRIHERIKFPLDHTIEDENYQMEINVVCQELLRRFRLLDLQQAAKYTMRELISPILLGALSLVNSIHSNPPGSVKLICEKNISGNSGNGPVDYILSYKSMDIVIGEAKKGDMVKGINQNLMQQWNFLESLADKILPSKLSGIKRKVSFNEQLNELTKLGTFGITSSGSHWVFSRVRKAHKSSNKPIAVLMSDVYDLSVIHQKMTPENLAVLRQQVDCLLRTIVEMMNTQRSLISSRFSFLLSDKIQTRLIAADDDDEEEIAANEAKEPNEFVEETEG